MVYPTYDIFLSMMPQLSWRQITSWQFAKGVVPEKVWAAYKPNDRIPWFYLELDTPDLADQVTIKFYANFKRNVDGKGKILIESLNPGGQKVELDNKGKRQDAATGEKAALEDGTLKDLLLTRYGLQIAPRSFQSRYSPVSHVEDEILSQELTHSELGQNAVVMLNLLGDDSFQVQEVVNQAPNGKMLREHRFPPTNDHDAAQRQFAASVQSMIESGFTAAAEIKASARALRNFKMAQSVTTPPAATLEGHVGSSSVDISQISSSFGGANEALKMAETYDSSLFLNIACIFRANGPFFGVYIPAVDAQKHLELVQSKLRQEGFSIQSQSDGSFRAWSPDPEVMPDEIQQRINELAKNNKLKGGNVFGVNIDTILRHARQNANQLSQDPKQQEQDYRDIAVLTLASTMVHEAVHAKTVADQSVAGESAVQALQQRYGASQGEAPSEAAQRSFMQQAIPLKNRERALKNLPPLDMSGPTVHAAAQNFTKQSSIQFPKTGDCCWSVDWCYELPIDKETKEVDIDRAKYAFERVATREEAYRIAASKFPIDKFGSVRIQAEQWDGFAWEEVGQPEFYEGERKQASLTALQKEAGKGSGCVMALLPSLLNLPKLIREEDLYTEEEGYGREDDTHVTLLYGLENDDPKESKEAIQQWFGKLTHVQLDGVGIFENDDKPYDVVKINVIADETLKAINAALRQLPNNNKFPDYKPHATLAYVKKGKGKNYVGLKMPKEAAVEKIVFSNSKSEYTTLWKSKKKEANWYGLVKEAQFGAQFTYHQAPLSDGVAPWAAMLWGGKGAATEKMLEGMRLADEEQKEHIEKRMQVERSRNPDRKERVDAGKSVEDLLDADRQPDAAYHSIESLMESHRVKPLTLLDKQPIQKKAFNYNLDPQVDVDSHHGPNTNVDIPMSVRVQTDFDDGLFMTWDESNDSDKNDPNNLKTVRRQPRYNPEYDWRGVYYEWKEPRYTPTKWEDESKEGAPAKRFGGSNLHQEKFAECLKIAGSLSNFLEQIQEKIGLGKQKGARTLLSLLTLQQVMRALDGKASVFKVSDDGEMATVWIAASDVDESQVQKAEAYAAGHSISAETMSAFDELTNLGQRKKMAAGEILRAAKAICNEFRLEDVGLIGGYPRLLVSQEPWCRLDALEFFSPSSDQCLKLASLLAENLGVKELHLNPENAAAYFVYDCLPCEFRFADNVTAGAWLEEEGAENSALHRTLFTNGFTADMLLYWLKDGRVYDVCRKSVFDMNAKTLRTYFDPEKMIAQNPLLILKAMQYAIRYHWQIAPELLQAMTNGVGLLDQEPRAAVLEAGSEVLREGISAAETWLKKIGLERLFDDLQRIQVITEDDHANSHQDQQRPQQPA